MLEAFKYNNTPVTGLPPPYIIKDDIGYFYVDWFSYHNVFDVIRLHPRQSRWKYCEHQFSGWNYDQITEEEFYTLFGYTMEEIVKKIKLESL